MKPYNEHLKSYKDLKTSYEETRFGFIKISLEKNRIAAPYISEARILQHKIKCVKDAESLLTFPEIRKGLITASGISDKAIKHLGTDGCTTAIEEFIRNYLIPSGKKFKEELVFRFLLTKGDSLGGSMRNIVGSLAQKDLNSSLIAALKIADRPFFWLNDASKSWILSSDNYDSTEIDNAKGISWKSTNEEPRVLYYNITVPIVKNNIDIILLNSTHEGTFKKIISSPKNFLALGELKGGIDPAGADEHWKTAKAAIDRIKSAFKKKAKSPNLFYIGAAIEDKMANEIFQLLKSGYIQNAANLTKKDHMSSIVEWLLKF